MNLDKVNSIFLSFLAYCRFCGGVEVLLNLLMCLVNFLNLFAVEVSRVGRYVFFVTDFSFSCQILI